MKDRDNRTRPVKIGRGGPPGSGMMRPAEKAKDFKGSLRRLSMYLKPYGLRLLLVFFVSVLGTMFTVLSPRIMGFITNKLVEGVQLKLKGEVGSTVDFDYIIRTLLVLGGLYIGASLFQYIQQFIMAGIAQKIVYDLRKEVNEKLSRLPLRYFDTNSTGDILSRVINDVDTISNTLQQSVTQLISSVITLVGMLGMMFFISPSITLVTLVTIPLSILFTKNIAKYSQGHFIAQAKALGELNGHIEEMYTGHDIVKAYGHERKAIEEFQRINTKLYIASWKAQFMSGIIMPLINLINNIGYILVAVFGGIFVVNGRISVGDVQAFIQYARQFTQPIVRTAEIANVIQSTIASAERVFELLDEEEEIKDPVDFKVLDNPLGKVEFQGVNFGYNEDEYLIEDMDMDINPGETVAIVGPTGAGKTTLVNLLMRFYEIDGGQITIDGIDTRKISRGKLRSIFGMVLQDTWLFNGSIRENIAYGREDATDEDIYKAAQLAQADHFIRTLPNGYDTILNEDASNISQGQRQLLTIARAILADPKILILDEATSSVDTRTEILIQKAMDQLMKGRTSFVIAHRLSTIRNADMILVMNKGKIVEKGTHEELMNQGGFYEELYNSQFAA